MKKVLFSGASTPVLNIPFKIMKKIILIVVIFLFLGSNNIVNSQFKVNYGVKAGLELAHVVAINRYYESSSDNKTGICLGGFIEPSFNKYISLIIETNYQQKGWRAEGLQINYSINCISVPLMLKLRTEAGRLSPYIQLGPKLDIVLHQDSANNLYSFHSYNFSLIDFGVVLGLGCETRVWKNDYLLAEMRYNCNFNSNFAVSGVESSSLFYSRSLEFLVGVKF